MPYKDPEKRKEVQKRRLRGSRVVVMRGSSRHIALSVMKVLRRPICKSDLQEINPTLFGRHTARVFLSLKEKGLAVETSPGYFGITNEGLKVINEIPIKYPRRAD